jgi:hypothetical protein
MVRIDYAPPPPLPFGIDNENWTTLALAGTWFIAIIGGLLCISIMVCICRRCFRGGIRPGRAIPRVVATPRVGAYRPPAHDPLAETTAAATLRKRLGDLFGVS